MSRTLEIPGLDGRLALVTGGSRGIGRAAAVLLASAGARVGIAYRCAADEAEETLAQMRQAAAYSSHDPRRGPWAQAADLATESGVVALFARLDAEFGGRLDVFVGNAGIWNVLPRPLEQLDLDRWRQMIEANLTSVYLTTRAAASRMGESGRIVLVSSTAAQRGEAGHSHYAASKGAIQSFVKSLAVELGPRGITVNAVAPGWVDTDMTSDILSGEGREAIEREIPLGRVAIPRDIGGPVVFLASELAAHVTGEILNVNGGSVLCG